jgi:hypothetical protein
LSTLNPKASALTRREQKAIEAGKMRIEADRLIKVHMKDGSEITRCIRKLPQGVD